MFPLLQLFKRALARLSSYLSEVAASESGELLSARRKAELLKTGKYSD